MLDPKQIGSLTNQISRLRKNPAWYRSSFPKQIAFIEDPAQLKVALCTRRAGKSYGMGMYMLKEAWMHPGVSIVYIGLTRDSAKKIVWKDILKPLDKEFGLNAEFHETNMTVTLPNGSVIYLTGADSRTDDMTKLLGQKFKLAVIDEASKYRIDIKALIFDVLKPAMSDYQGTIAMIGTPSDFIKSYMADVTSGRIDDGWSVHKWTAQDNPHMREQFQEEIRQLTATNPKVAEEAWFRQNYYGEWVVDDTKLIYNYTTNNLITELPDSDHYTHILGITLSYRGYTGISVVAYSQGHPEAFVVYSAKHENMSLYHVVEEAGRLNNIYNFSTILCTDASKQLAEAIRQRYLLSIQEVTDKDKTGLITLFNAELRQNKIKVLGDNTDLLNEWDSIIQDDRISVKHTSKILEHPVCHNFVADATLYAWQKCYNFYFEPTSHSEDPIDSYWKAKEDSLRDHRSKPYSDDDFYSGKRIKKL